MPLRWTPAHYNDDGLDGWWPLERPSAETMGWYVARVIDYRSYFRVSFNGIEGEQPIRCRFGTAEDARQQADAWFDTHPELRPGKRKRHERDWY